jgi:hypothetical protein
VEAPILLGSDDLTQTLVGRGFPPLSSGLRFTILRGSSKSAHESANFMASLFYDGISGVSRICGNLTYAQILS